MASNLILYSRGYCHLCDDMQKALAPLQAQYGFGLDVVDVDGDPALLARYDELVPVLALRMPDGEPQVLCHYFLDADLVRAVLTTA